MTRKPIDGWGNVALLAALSLFLSTIEFIIPKPPPFAFLRIGVANLAFLIGLRLLRPRQLLALMAVKVLAQGILFGTLFSHVSALSAAGTLAGGLGMLAADRLFGRRVSLVGVSVCGAVLSNAAQLAAAGLLFLGDGIWLFAPPIFAVGTAAAVILGLLAERFTAKSEWVRKHSLQP